MSLKENVETMAKGEIAEGMDPREYVWGLVMGLAIVTVGYLGAVAVCAYFAWWLGLIVGLMAVLRLNYSWKISIKLIKHYRRLAREAQSETDAD